MAIKAGIWNQQFAIEWSEGEGGPSEDERWRMRILDGGALHFEGLPLSDPPSTLILPPRTWQSLKVPSLGALPKKSRIRCSDAIVWSKGEECFRPAKYEVQILDDGALILCEQISPESEAQSHEDEPWIEVVAPQAWKRVRTPAIDFLTARGTKWSTAPYHGSWGLSDPLPPGYNGDDRRESPECRVRILDGSVLLFQEMSAEKEFIFVAPSSWKMVHLASDFTR